MRKVRITKEQLETIVESTLGKEQPEEINELYGTETFLDPMVIEALAEAIKNLDWEQLKHLYNSFESIRALVGGIAGVGLITGGIAYVRSEINKYFKNHPEEAEKLNANKEKIVKDLKQ